VRPFHAICLLIVWPFVAAGIAKGEPAVAAAHTVCAMLVTYGVVVQSKPKEPQ